MQALYNIHTGQPWTRYRPSFHGRYDYGIGALGPTGRTVVAFLQLDDEANLFDMPAQIIDQQLKLWYDGDAAQYYKYFRIHFNRTRNTSTMHMALHQLNSWMVNSEPHEDSVADCADYKNGR